MPNGYILFAELKPIEPVSNQTQTKTAVTSSSTTANTIGAESLAQYNASFQTTHGYKNVFGTVVISLTTYTTWTFDFFQVVDGVITNSGNPNMIGWSSYLLAKTKTAIFRPPMFFSILLEVKSR